MSLPLYFVSPPLDVSSSSPHSLCNALHSPPLSPTSPTLLVSPVSPSLTCVPGNLATGYWSSLWLRRHFLSLWSIDCRASRGDQFWWFTGAMARRIHCKLKRMVWEEFSNFCLIGNLLLKVYLWDFWFEWMAFFEFSGLLVILFRII